LRKILLLKVVPRCGAAAASWNHVEGNLIKIKAITLLAVPPYPVNNTKSDGAFGELILLISQCARPLF
jgi:hypothetical protein